MLSLSVTLLQSHTSVLTNSKEGLRKPLAKHSNVKQEGLESRIGLKIFYSDSGEG